MKILKWVLYRRFDEVGGNENDYIEPGYLEKLAQKYNFIPEPADTIGIYDDEEVGFKALEAHPSHYYYCPHWEKHMLTEYMLNKEVWTYADDNYPTNDNNYDDVDDFEVLETYFNDYRKERKGSFKHLKEAERFSG